MRIPLLHLVLIKHLALTDWKGWAMKNYQMIIGAFLIATAIVIMGILISSAIRESMIDLRETIRYTGELLR